MREIDLNYFSELIFDKGKREKFIKEAEKELEKENE